MRSRGGARTYSLTLLVAVTGVIFACGSEAAGPDPERSPDGVPQRLVLAVDGIP